MKFKPVSLVHVYYKPKNKKILVGRLALKEHKIYFEYDVNFLELGLNLSPFKLPAKPGVIPSSDFVFDGLFGVFNDSLPDGWGRLLLDRHLMKHHINPGSLSMLDRLCFVGAGGMGALIYEPEVENSYGNPGIDIDIIADEVSEFQENDNDSFVEDLLVLGGSSAGARPKALLNIEGENWIIKFPSSIDPKDIGAIEYAYHLMAIEAGLDVAAAKIFPSRKGQYFFGAKRFDKLKDESIHMHTVSGLLHADHRIPGIDYKDIIRATMHLTKDMKQCEKQFSHCVFNILSHNRDDHAKNFSFLMDENGDWMVSPAYDLTFSSGLGGEHCSMVMGEGKNPGITHLLELAKVSNIKESIAKEIICQVESAVCRWESFAKIAGVGASSTKMIGSAIKAIIKNSFR